MRELVLAVFSCLALFAQTLEVVPNRVLLDESAANRAHRLEPNERVTIRSGILAQSA
jgi:hypothetical protein